MLVPVAFLLAGVIRTYVHMQLIFRPPPDLPQVDASLVVV
jgi:hypothetical protein